MTRQGNEQKNIHYHKWTQPDLCLKINICWEENHPKVPQLHLFPSGSWGKGRIDIWAIHYFKMRQLETRGIKQGDSLFLLNSIINSRREYNKKVTRQPTPENSQKFLKRRRKYTKVYDGVNVLLMMMARCLPRGYTLRPGQPRWTQNSFP